MFNQFVSWITPPELFLAQSDVFFFGGVGGWDRKRWVSMKIWIFVFEGPIFGTPWFFGWLRNFWLFLPTTATSFHVSDTFFLKNIGAMVGEKIVQTNWKSLKYSKFISIAVSGSFNRWDRWYIITQLAVYTTYIPLVVLANWVIICYLLTTSQGNQETAIDHRAISSLFTPSCITKSRQRGTKNTFAALQ